MIKCMIFFGDRKLDAARKFNVWSRNHPECKVVSISYQQICAEEHSICVAYEEIEDGDDSK